VSAKEAEVVYDTANSRFTELERALDEAMAARDQPAAPGTPHASSISGRRHSWAGCSGWRKSLGGWTGCPRYHSHASVTLRHDHAQGGAGGVTFLGEESLTR
jgi:hypothetical protein